MQGVLQLARFFSSHPLTRDAPAKAWTRFITWQVASRLRDEVIYPWVGGRKLAVRRGMTGATGNIYAGLHEFADMMLPLHFLRAGDLFFDVGANVGTYTVLAAGVCGAEVMAFEPDPGTAQHLRRNLEINDLDTLASVHEVALGDRDGQVHFTVGLDTVNKVTAGTGAMTRTVEQRTLDGIAADRSPIMIKIDVEGYEEAVLRGGLRVLNDPQLKVVLIETATGEIQALMRACGFEKAYYDPFERNLSRSPVGHASANTLFVRDMDAVSARLRATAPVHVLGRSI